MTSSKLSVDIKPSKYIKYDSGQLLDTLVYFCWQKFKPLGIENLPEIYIGINSDETQDMEHCGMFDVLDDNLAYILLSPKELSAEKYRYKNKIKSLLQMFLHEFYHMFKCIDTHIKRGGAMPLHEWQAKRYSAYKQECKDMIESGIDKDMTYYYSKEEMAAEAFSFENLAYIENLYNYGFLVIPPDAI
jgi:hypothetical protein